MKGQICISSTFLISLLGMFLFNAHEASGRSSGIPAPRILGGSSTSEGDWPFMAYLFERPKGPLNGFVCGGSLISNQWVLIAAHCIISPNPILYGIVLGEHTRSVMSANEQVFNVSKIVRHSRFDILSFLNDIALIKLSKPATINQYVSVVNLAAAANCSVPEPLFLSSSCYTLGWGKTSNSGSYSDTLKQLSSIYYPQPVCNHLISTTSEKYNNRLVQSCEKRFCAGIPFSGQDSCQGDSGGPFVCRHSNNQYYVHGILSYGTITCGQGLPAVFTKVAEMRTWITTNMTP